ncbi:MAG: Gfo/Idh/MocA family protein [Candidatus Dormibacteria bacterium]
MGSRGARSLRRPKGERTGVRGLHGAAARHGARNLMAARIGVVGCGNVLDLYMPNLVVADGVEVVACCDLDPGRAAAAAGKWRIEALDDLDTLLADDRVDVVLNLTTPLAHFEVSRQALIANKHVYSEKPLATTFEDGARLVKEASRLSRRLGCAPDTFLGPGLQLARRMVDDGVIGDVIAADAAIMFHGHEDWHPSPRMYYQPGGGPLFDMGVYYLTALVALLGPVNRVAGLARASFSERLVGSGPMKGMAIPVEVATHVAGVAQLSAGPLISIGASFDVWNPHEDARRLRVFGSQGTIDLPDPNAFAGTVRLWRPGAAAWTEQASGEASEMQLRGLGLIDMVRAIEEARPHRASSEMALHVLEMMEGIVGASGGGDYRNLTSTFDRPACVDSRLPPSDTAEGSRR